MSFFKSLSLRSRIAITVFFLGTFLLVAVLLITLNFIEQNEIKNTNTQHETIFELLKNMSQTALFAQQYDQLQQTIEQLSKDPQIINIQLVNNNNIVVVSNDFALVGSKYWDMPITSLTRQFTSELDGLGKLYTTFSFQQITETVTEARDIGLVLTLIGVSLITLVGYVTGFLLTRRLVTLTNAVVAFDANDVIDKDMLNSSDDEVGQLTGAFIDMSNKISSNVMALKQNQEELNKLNTRLQELSELDTLTHIANRRKFEVRFEYEMNTAERSGDPFSLLMVDVDYFKNYNDTYGHPAGDRVLQRVAQCIAENLPRKTDFVARYGGEEFVVLLPSTDINGAYQVAENIRKKIYAMEITHTGSEKYENITISLGVNVFHIDDDAEDILGNADKALYTAKLNGRNCTKIYGRN